MGSSIGGQFKPIFDDNTDLPADLQAAVDYAERVGGLLTGPRAERVVLTSGQVAEGWLFSETDTGRIYLRRLGAWILMWGSLSAMMRRSSTSVTVLGSSWNQNLSVSTYWDEDWRDSGIDAYNNGWKVPVGGEWEIDWGFAFNTSGTVGITVNKATVAGFTDFVGFGSGLEVQAAALGQGRRRLRLAANDVIRLFGASVGASATWFTTPSLSWFGIRYVGA